MTLGTGISLSIALILLMLNSSPQTAKQLLPAEKMVSFKCLPHRQQTGGLRSHSPALTWVLGSLDSQVGKLWIYYLVLASMNASEEDPQVILTPLHVGTRIHTYTAYTHIQIKKKKILFTVNLMRVMF